MGKLKTLSGSDVCRILERNGFVQTRQRGSHILMQKRTAVSTVSVPVPNHKEIRIGTLQSIIRQTGLPRELFEI